MSAVTVQILMLRHGQSEWNSVRRWQGTADSPLTQLGRQQALSSARILAALGREFSAVWTSDLCRASQTAEIIAATLGLGEPIVEPRLREAYAGEWEGLTPDEIETRWPGWLEAHHRPATFESFADVVARAEAAMGDIAASAARSSAALVVAHSGVIRSLIRDLGGSDGRVPNLGGRWFMSSVTGDRSDLALGDVFDPRGIVVSGVDAPGEDPGE
jgi:probable phosphoglycerate mutase